MRRWYLHPFLVPGVGLLQLAIVTGYVIYGSRPISTSLPITVVLGLLIISLLVGTRVVRGAPVLAVPAVVQFAHGFRRQTQIFAAAAALATTLSAILWPVLSTGAATTPYRIGIDQVGYAESAQFLVEGGTLQRANRTLLAELDTNNVRKAKAQSYKDTNFETYVDTEFLVKAFRWGYPGALATLTILTGNAHVFKIEFILLVFSYALLAALTYHIARTIFSLPVWYASASMAAVALNCNLLNTYYEGQFAQIFVLPYFVLFFLLFMKVRRISGGLSSCKAADVSRYIMFAMMITAGLLSAFNEVLVLLFGLVAATVAFDFLFYRRSSFTALAIVLLGVAAGFLVVFPFSHQWIAYTIANLSGLSRAGFWQPHWASFSEIVGLLDMYQVPGYSLQPRPPENVSLNVGISIIAMFAIVRFMLHNREVDRSFWLAAPALVLAEYFKSRYFDGILNYPFTKVCTMLIPLLVVLLLAAIYRFTREQHFALGLGAAATSLTMIGTGLFYISHYTEQRQYVTADMFALYTPDGTRRFDRFALLTNHQDIRQYMYAPLVSMHWLDESGVQKYFRADFERSLVTVLRQDDMSCRQCVDSYFAGHIVYEDATTLMIDTGIKVKSFCAKEVGGQSIETLNYDPQQTWRKEVIDYSGTYVTSYRQCDFGYVKKLLSRSHGTT